MNNIEKLMHFIDATPNAYIATVNIAEILLANGFTELCEGEKWTLVKGQKYFVRRNGSSLIAFAMNETDFDGYSVVSAHLDSPAFRLKPSPEDKGEYLRLKVEKYGGMNLSTWLDRPLSVAGRLVARTDNGIEAIPVDLSRNAAVIPSVAIHLMRNINDGVAYNPAVDMTALYGQKENAGTLLHEIADKVNVSPDDIISTDLFLYNREPASLFGAENEFFSAPRIDDLECAYAGLLALLSADSDGNLPVLALFDNEEVGSGTRQGADSTFLFDVFTRINGALGDSESDYLCRIANSFMLSADNAHAMHPNHPELSDTSSAPKPNGGVVIKFNANQKYATDAVSYALFSEICARNGIPTQTYTNRSDLPGGSTLGNISERHISLTTIDIGLAQFAMHSAYESAGALDFDYMTDAMRAFYNTPLHMIADGKYEI